eukprot:876092-Karenia_brevis.AAC.1
MHVVWKERYHGTLPSAKVNKYIRNYSANMGATARAHAHPERSAQPRGAKSSRDDDNVTQAQPDNRSKNES